LASLLLPFASIAQAKKPTISIDCQKLGALAANNPECFNSIPPKQSASRPNWVNVGTLTDGSQLNVDKRSIVKNKDNSVEGSFGVVFRVPKQNAVSEVFRVKADCPYKRVYTAESVYYDVNGNDIEATEITDRLGKTYLGGGSDLAYRGIIETVSQRENLEKKRTYLKPSPFLDSINNFLLKGLCSK
jgi:hypothetical protein